jgi:predicted metalloprotease
MRTRRFVISGAALIGVIAGGTAFAGATGGNSSTTTTIPVQSSPVTTAVAAGSPTTGPHRTDLHLQAVLDRNGATNIQRALHAPNQTGEGQWASMPEFLQYVVNDAKSVWNWYYQQNGLNIVSDVNTVFVGPGDSVPTGCRDDADDSAFFYCPADDTIYISQARAVRKWNGTDGYDGEQNRGGDYAVAVAVAHEYGHNVQHELGLPTDPNFVMPSELQADCLAGAFTRIASIQGILDETDVEEGSQARSDVGDYSTDPTQHHGTPEQRAEAFSMGFDNEAPSVCSVYNPA